LSKHTRSNHKRRKRHPPSPGYGEARKITARCAAVLCFLCFLWFHLLRVSSSWKTLARSCPTLYVALMATSAYLVYGSDEYRVSAKSKEIIDKLLSPEEQAFGLETVDGAVENSAAAINAIGKCIEAVSTRGLFGGKKVVWFRDVSFLSDTQTGKVDAVKEQLDHLTAAIKAGLPAGQSLVMSSPSVDKRFAFYKSCKDVCEIHEFSMPEQNYAAERQAKEVLAEILRRTGLTMNGDAREAFLEKVGTDTRNIANEIDKLAVFLGKRRNAETSDIEAVTSSSRESKAWDLSDAFGKRDLGQCLEIMRRLTFQGESPIMLISVIEGRIRDLSIFRKALDAGWLTLDRGYKGETVVKWQALPPEADKMFSEYFEKDPRKTHPYRAGLLLAQAKSFSPGKLMQCQKAAVEAHEKMVSTAVPDEMLLEFLLIQMLS
jgi:DNA polymerase III subunit delta